jgi:hypothetical protein
MGARGGWRTGSERSIIVSTRLKIAALAPMANASVIATTALKPGLRTRLQRVAHVTPDVVEPGAVASCSHAFDRLLHATEIEYGHSLRFSG